MPDNPNETIPQQTNKRAFIKSYGCQMNVHDSQRMSDILSDMGYAITPSLQDADIIILNTCHIRQKATEKIFTEIGRIKIHKQKRMAEGKKTLLGIAGCVAQAQGKEILNRAKSVDFIFGPQTIHRLPDIIKRTANTTERPIEVSFQAQEKFTTLPQPYPQTIRARGVSAFLTIQEGCDKFCTFCVVPYTRGAEYSRPPEQIMKEARSLVDAGVKEIILLGQNVNAWHGEDESGKHRSFAYLIQKLADIEPLRRIRYTTSHPRDMDDALIAAHRDNPKLMPWLHLPVQSGSDRILTAMNRKHKSDDYRRIIDRIRTARPDIALSSDFIVGFPGESEQDFEDTLRLVNDVTFASAFSFKYSPRPGTPAAEKENQIPDHIAAERLHRLQSLLEEQKQAFNRSCKNLVLDILLEKPGRKSGQLIGKTPYFQSTHITAETDRIGQIVPVRIDTVGNNGLGGCDIAKPANPNPDPHIYEPTAVNPSQTRVQPE